MFTLAMSAGVLHGRLVQLPVKLGLRPPGESAHALRCEVANLHSHLHEGVDRDLVARWFFARRSITCVHPIAWQQGFQSGSSGGFSWDIVSFGRTARRESPVEARCEGAKLQPMAGTGA